MSHLVTYTCLLSASGITERVPNFDWILILNGYLVGQATSFVLYSRLHLLCSSNCKRINILLERHLKVLPYAWFLVHVVQISQMLRPSGTKRFSNPQALSSA